MKATIIGGNGFVGKHLIPLLQDKGMDVYCPNKGDDLTGMELGTVFYCAGITADFRNRKLESIIAHTCYPVHLLANCFMERIIYFSSSRVYINSDTGKEDCFLSVNPEQPDDLYHASKLMGEMAAAASGTKYYVIRPSNIVGDNWQSADFLYSITENALVDGEIHLQTAPDSSKDYVDVDFVAEATLALVLSDAPSGIYNASSGCNLTHSDVVNIISNITGSKVSFAKNARTISFPRIDNTKILQATGLRPGDPRKAIEKMVRGYQAHLETPSTQ